MAIRYVAPTIDQPSQEDMRQSYARQQNVFNAGRNLTRALVRQNAIDNALYQQRQAVEGQQPAQVTQPTMGSSLEELQRQFADRTGNAAHRAAQQQIQAQDMETLESNRQAMRSGLLPGYLRTVATELPDLSGVEAIADRPLPAGSVYQAGAVAPVMRGDVSEGQRRGKAARMALGGSATTRPNDQFGAITESFAGAPTNVYTDHYYSGDREANARRIAAVLAKDPSRMTAFGPGGRAVVVDSDEELADREDFFSPTYRFNKDPLYALGTLEQPMILGTTESNLPERVRFSPNLAGILDAPDKPVKTTDKLFDELAQADDKAEWVRNYLSKNSGKNPADQEFRAALSEILATEGMYDLESGGLDLQGVTDSSSLSGLTAKEKSQILGQNRQRLLEESLAELLQFDGTDYGLFTQRLGAGESLEGRISPEMLRRMARGE